jgi:glucosamine-6-phosphate deaminase
VNIITVNNYEVMSEKAAAFVADRINEKSNLNLGLLTGGTVEGMYEKLTKLYNANKVDFSKITTFNTDEYYPIKKDNAQSYWHYMKNKFFDYVNIKPANINFLNGESIKIDEECKRYEKNIVKSGGIDLLVLGIGRNGHIAFISQVQKVGVNCLPVSA